MYSEQKYLEEEIKWEESSKMIYSGVLMKLPDLIKYGYMRLCEQWLKGHKITTVNNQVVLGMLKDILPSEQYNVLLQSL